LNQHFRVAICDMMVRHRLCWLLLRVAPCLSCVLIAMGCSFGLSLQGLRSAEPGVLGCVAFAPVSELLPVACLSCIPPHLRPDPALLPFWLG
jgi:hypothetical protein